MILMTALRRTLMWLWWLALPVVAAGCEAPVLTVPSDEVKGLLALPPATVGLTEEQSTALRSLLDRSTSAQEGLEHHLAGESQRLKQLMGDGEPVMGQAIVAQVGLVNQLRMERLLMPVLLREQTQSMLTPDQQMWWVRNRLKVIFPP